MSEDYRHAFQLLSQDIQNAIDILERKATAAEHEGEEREAAAHRGAMRMLRKIHAGESPVEVTAIGGRDAKWEN